MSEEALNTPASDPLHSVADALDAAAQAAKDGAGDAADAASKAIPVIGGMLTGLAYKTCYGVSYGVVFPTMLAVHAIPKDNALVHGLIDGARAAVDLVDEMKSKNAPPEP